VYAGRQRETAIDVVNHGRLFAGHVAGGNIDDRDFYALVTLLDSRGQHRPRAAEAAVDGQDDLVGADRLGGDQGAIEHQVRVVGHQ
jgi:hypothetical protein